jgi:hypothetical protein
MHSSRRRAGRTVAARAKTFGLLCLGVSVLCSCSGIEREYHVGTSGSRVPTPEKMPFEASLKGLLIGVDPVVEQDRQKDLFDADFESVGVVPLLVSVVNQGDSPLLIRSSDMRLEFADGTQLSSIGAYAVLSKLEQNLRWGSSGITQSRPLPGVTADTLKPNEVVPAGAIMAAGVGVAGIGVAAGVTGAALAGAVSVATASAMAIGLAGAFAGLSAGMQKMIEITEAREVRKGDYLKKQFPDSQLGPNQSAQGFVYFIPPAGSPEFSEAMLKVWGVNPANATGIMVKAPLRKARSRESR